MIFIGVSWPTLNEAPANADDSKRCAPAANLSSAEVPS